VAVASEFLTIIVDVPSIAANVLSITEDLAAIMAQFVSLARADLAGKQR
jgi:hypothetical protein